MIGDVNMYIMHICTESVLKDNQKPDERIIGGTEFSCAVQMVFPTRIKTRLRALIVYE